LNKKEFLENICMQIQYKPVRKSIAEELEMHIQEKKDAYMESGMQEVEAEETAVLEMGLAKEIGKQLNKIHKPKMNWKLFGLIFILMAFGMLAVILKKPFMENSYIGNTILYMFIGMGVSVGIYFFPYYKMKPYSTAIYGMASLIMMLPMLQMGCTIGGVYHARLFSITFFPPMIAVPLYSIAIAGYIACYDKQKVWKITILNKAYTIHKDFVKILLLCGISLVLMMEIPSIANAGILGVTYIVMATAKMLQDQKDKLKKYVTIYGTLCVVVLTFSAFLLTQGGSSFRGQRMIASFHPETDPLGAGYVGMLQKDIVENAKLIGEAETEAISNEASIINVESNYTFIYLLGKAGILVAGLLALTVIGTSIKLIMDATKVKEEYGKCIMIGLGSIYILQSVATILMNLNLGIQMHMNLPFVSYGGVYLVVNLASIALIASIYRRKDIVAYEETKENKRFTILKIGGTT